MDEAQRLEFVRTEYQESAKAFALGVQFGQDLLRSYLFGTAVLVTFLGAAVSLLKERILLAEYAVFAIPIVGIAASFLGIFLLRHYDKHLQGCCDRCVEIESQFDGKIFTGIKRISDAAIFNGVRGFQIICVLFVLMWISFLFVALSRPIPSAVKGPPSQSQGPG